MGNVPGFRTSTAHSLLPVFLLSCFSGAISLGYQVIWFRLCADRFGSTNLTFLLVLVSFIGGLGLGSLVSRRFSSGVSRFPALGDPLSLVGAIEVAIACAALLTLVVDFKALLRALDPGRLSCGKRLTEILSEPGLVRTVVPDFPARTSNP